MNRWYDNSMIQIGAVISAPILLTVLTHSQPLVPVLVPGAVSAAEAYWRLAAPDISVKGNSLEIPDGDTTPNLADGTDFGTVNLFDAVEHEFRVGNEGTSVLTFANPPNPKISGPHAGDFVVSDSVTLPISPGVFKRFAIIFMPTGTGLRSATVRFDSDDPDESPYTFEIQGRGAPVLSCTGFEPPMDAGPVVVKKKNRALPLKAQLFDAIGAVTDLDIVSVPVLQVIFSSVGGGPPVDVTDDSLAGGRGTEGNQFVFTEEGKWQFNLKTKNYTAEGTYTITMVSGDESEYIIDPTCTAQYVIQ